MDKAHAVLSDNNGLIDLTGKKITFVMKDLFSGENRFEIICIPSCIYNGKYYSAARGGVTIPFSAIETTLSGVFKGEFVVTSNDATVHIPSGNLYISIMVWESV